MCTSEKVGLQGRSKLVSSWICLKAKGKLFPRTAAAKGNASSPALVLALGLASNRLQLEQRDRPKCIGADQTPQIDRPHAIDSFAHQHQDFVVDARADGQPVQVHEKWGHVVEL